MFHRGAIMIDQLSCMVKNRVRTPDNSEPATGTTLGRDITAPRQKEKNHNNEKYT